MKKILLVDDEELVLKSLEKLLKREGYEVICARSGKEAIEQIKSTEVHLIVTDIRMPEANGISLIEEIRALLKKENRKSIPEICITGYAEDEVSRRAEQIKVSDYLYKPFDLRDFLTAVKKHLGV